MLLQCLHLLNNYVSFLCPRLQPRDLSDIKIIRWDVWKFQTYYSFECISQISCTSWRHNDGNVFLGVRHWSAHKGAEGELNQRIIPHVVCDVLLCAYSAAEEEMQAERVAMETTHTHRAWFHLPPLLSSSPTAFQCFSILSTFINFPSLPCSPSRNSPPSDYICLLLWSISHSLCWISVFHHPPPLLPPPFILPSSLTVCIFNLLVLLSSLHSFSLSGSPFMSVSCGWTAAPCDWQVEMLSRNHWMSVRDQLRLSAVDMLWKVVFLTRPLAIVK